METRSGLMRRSLAKLLLFAGLLFITCIALALGALTNSVIPALLIIALCIAALVFVAKALTPADLLDSTAMGIITIVAGSFAIVAFSANSTNIAAVSGLIAFFTFIRLAWLVNRIVNRWYNSGIPENL